MPGKAENNGLDGLPPVYDWIPQDQSSDTLSLQTMVEDEPTVFSKGPPRHKESTLRFTMSFP
jgi:hypothetical protein